MSTSPAPRPRAVPDARARTAGLFALPLAGAAVVGATAWLAPGAVLAVTAVVAVLAAAAAAGLVLADARRGRLAAEQAVEHLLAALDEARGASVSDEATALLNRRGLVLVAQQVLASARRSGGAVHGCVVEVTPAVRLGARPSEEDVAAQRLEEWRATAAALRAATRATDVVAREDEGRFLVVGPGAGLHAQELERRVRVGLAQGRLEAGGQRSARLAVEVGVAVLAPWDEGGVEDLLLAADQALQQRRALRRSSPVHGWGRRRGDRSGEPSGDRPGEAG
ncbi:diguanylate cyclase domain-containing protein [Kineococcus terrestris]|uniref:diguanylate cyclase domain-containing protein n=1 Tax=Kineococcus terrestris TaxID=2044856 RepID=UPI0034DACF20